MNNNLIYIGIVVAIGYFLLKKQDIFPSSSDQLSCIEAQRERCGALPAGQERCECNYGTWSGITCIGPHTVC